MLHKKWFKILITTSLPLLLTYLAFFSFFSYKIEKLQIKNLLNKSFEVNFHKAVSINQIKFSPFFNITLKDIKISHDSDFNDRELLLFIPELEAQLSFLELLKGNIFVKRVKVSNFLSHLILPKDELPKVIQRIFSSDSENSAEKVPLPSVKNSAITPKNEAALKNSREEVQKTKNNLKANLEKIYKSAEPLPVEIKNSLAYLYYPIKIKEEAESMISFESYGNFYNDNIHSLKKKEYLLSVRLADINGQILFSMGQQLKWKLIGKITHSENSFLFDSLQKKIDLPDKDCQYMGPFYFRGKISGNEPFKLNVSIPLLKAKYFNQLLTIIKEFPELDNYLADEAKKSNDKRLSNESRTIEQKGRVESGSVSIFYSAKSDWKAPRSKEISKDYPYRRSEFLSYILNRQAKGMELSKDSLIPDFIPPLTKEQIRKEEKQKSNPVPAESKKATETVTEKKDPNILKDLWVEHWIQIKGEKLHYSYPHQKDISFHLLKNLDFLMDGKIFIQNKKLLCKAVLMHGTKPLLLAFAEFHKKHKLRKMELLRLDLLNPVLDLKELSSVFIPDLGIHFRGKFESALSIDRKGKKNDLTLFLKLDKLDMIRRLTGDTSEAAIIKNGNMLLSGENNKLNSQGYFSINDDKIDFLISGLTKSNMNDFLFDTYPPRTNWQIIIKSKKIKAELITNLASEFQKYLTEEILVQSKDDFKPEYFGETTLGRFSRNTSLELKFDIDELNLYGASFRPLKLTIIHEPNRIRIGDFITGGYDGKYGISGYINLPYRAPYMAFEAYGKNINLKKLNRDIQKKNPKIKTNPLWEKGNLDGDLSITFDFTSYGARLIRIYKGMEKNLEIRTSKGNIQGFDILEKWYAESSDLKLKKNLLTIPFDSLTFKSSTKNQYTSVDNLSLQANGIDLYGSGYIDPKKGYQVKLRAKFSAPYSENNVYSDYAASGFLHNLRIKKLP